MTTTSAAQPDAVHRRRSAAAPAVRLLAKRELTRLLRQPGRLIASIATPLLIYAFLGSGFAEALAADAVGEGGLAAFLMPGLLALIILASAVMTSIAIIEDRQAGWLRGVIVSPAPRWSIAAGTVLGAAAVAAVQAAILLPAVFVLGHTLTIAGVVLSCVVLAIIAVAMCGLGFALAWRTESAASFHGVMNLVFMPMWLLSSALVPPAGAAEWFAFIIRINPMTWWTESLRGAMSGEIRPVPTLLTIGFAAAMFIIASVTASRSRRPALD
mgnify:CR=1 FL=1